VNFKLCFYRKSLYIVQNCDFFSRKKDIYETAENVHDSDEIHSKTEMQTKSNNFGTSPYDYIYYFEFSLVWYSDFASGSVIYCL
jgi:hypothetical protein